MAEIKPWPKQPAGRPLPRRVLRPCDASLLLAVEKLETQLGTVEAYNRIVEAAEGLKARIDAGDVKAQNPIYAVDPRGANGVGP